MSILNPPGEIVGRDYMGHLKFASPGTLKDRIGLAIAWGVPDRESAGMSQESLTDLLRESQKRIRQLEQEVSVLKGRLP